MGGLQLLWFVLVDNSRVEKLMKRSPMSSPAHLMSALHTEIDDPRTTYRLAQSRISEHPLVRTKTARTIRDQTRYKTTTHHIHEHSEVRP